MRINNSYRLLSTPIPPLLLPKNVLLLFAVTTAICTPMKGYPVARIWEIFACEIWNPGLLTPKIQFREFTIPLTIIIIGIRNPSSTDKEYQIQYWDPKSSVRNPKSKTVLDHLTLIFQEILHWVVFACYQFSHSNIKN